MGANADMRFFSDAELGALLPLPATDANKYTRGRLLIVGGSRRYSGAALLATLAATRSGAGYVTLATSAEVAAAVRGQVPTVPIVELPSTSDGDISGECEVVALLQGLAGDFDALLLGPGLGRSVELMSLVCELVGSIASGGAAALVLDADALFAYAGEHVDELPSEHPLVLTPHAGELRRLTGSSDVGSARELAIGERCVVAKGPVTHIYAHDFATVQTDAPSCLATAGSGDVLAGVIAALLAQGLEPQDAACLGVRLQTKAAVAASAVLTPLCMNARDLIEHLPDAVFELLEAAGRIEEGTLS